jgi:hypothetical protein
MQTALTSLVKTQVLPSFEDIAAYNKMTPEFLASAILHEFTLEFLAKPKVAIVIVSSRPIDETISCEVCRLAEHCPSRERREREKLICFGTLSSSPLLQVPTSAVPQ